MNFQCSAFAFGAECVDGLVLRVQAALRSSAQSLSILSILSLLSLCFPVCHPTDDYFAPSAQHEVALHGLTARFPSPTQKWACPPPPIDAPWFLLLLAAAAFPSLLPRSDCSALVAHAGWLPALPGSSLDHVCSDSNYAPAWLPTEAQTHPADHPSTILTMEWWQEARWLCWGWTTFSRLGLISLATSQ